MSAPRPPMVVGHHSRPGRGWPTLEAHDVVAGPGVPLRLAPDPAGPGRLDDADGTLGGLVGPRWVAAGGPCAVLVLTADDRVVALAGAEGPRELADLSHGPRAPSRGRTLASAHGLLWLVDDPPGAGGRVQVMTLRDWVVLAEWSGLGAVDVAPLAGGALVLARDGRVWRTGPTLGRPVPLPCSRPIPGGACRIALDRDGGIHVLAAGPSLVELDADGDRVGATADAASLGARFDAPAIAATAGVARIPAALLGSGPAGAAREVGRDGCPPPPPPDPPAPLIRHLREGRWTSRRIDSGLDGTVWHRLELILDRLPRATAVEVEAIADDDRSRRPPADRAWQPVLGVTGSEAGGPAYDETVFRGLRGRNLWLRVTLRGDGTDSPAVGALRVHAPRESYVEHLPAVFGDEPRSREFLERFLAIAQTTWDDIERDIALIPLAFDPATVPRDGRRRALLDMLAGWIGARLEPAWSDEQRRWAIEAEPSLAPRRGTRAAIAEEVRLVLAGLAGLEPADLGDAPVLVESFAARGAAEPGRAGRAELGTTALLDGGEAPPGPQRTPIAELAEHAHRFSAYVPASIVRTQADELAVRRALDRARPAHTAYELCLVEPRMTLGVRSTLGLDTVVAGFAPARLAASGVASGDPAERPPDSGSPGPVLGVDAVLVTGDPDDPPRPPRLGVDPILVSL